MPVIFEDGFTDPGSAPQHEDFVGSFGNHQIIPTQAANGSFILKRLAEVGPEGEAPLYNHNDATWNAIWLPKNHLDSEGLGFAQYADPSQTPEYTGWVDDILLRITSEYELDRLSLIGQGTSEDAAERQALVNAAANVKGLQNFIQEALVIGDLDGNKAYSPQIVLTSFDPYVYASASLSPFNNFTNNPLLQFDGLTGTQAFADGQGNLPYSNLDFLRADLQNSLDYLVSAVERAQIVDPDVPGSELDPAVLNVFKNFVEQSENGGLAGNPLTAVIFAATAGVLAKSFGREVLGATVTSAEAALVVSGDKSLVEFIGEGIAEFAARVVYGPGIGAILASVQGLSAARDIVEKLSKQYPEWQFIRTIETEIREFEQVYDEFDVVRLYDNIQKILAVSGDATTNENETIGTLILSGDGAKVVTGVTDDLILHTGPGEVRTNAGTDTVILTAAAPTGEVELSTSPDLDVFVEGGNDNVILTDNFFELEADQLNQVSIDGGDGDDLITYENAPAGVSFQVADLTNISAAVLGLPHALKGFETVLGSAVAADIIEISSLDFADGSGVSTIDLAGQEDGGRDTVDATYFSDGIFVDLRNFSQQFAQERAFVDFQVPETEHATSEGTFRELALKNASVSWKLLDILLEPPEFRYDDQAGGLHLKNVEAVIGSDHNDVIFGPDEFSSQPQSISHQNGFATENLGDGAGTPGHAIIKSGDGEDVIILGRERTEVDAGADNDIIISVNGKASTIEGGDGDDIIITKGNFGRGGIGSIVKGGDGDDTFYVHDYGSHVYGGEGTDTFYWADHMRIYDAEADERLSLFGIPVVGGVGAHSIGEESNVIYNTVLKWVELHLSTEGDLVVRWAGRDTFVADYVGGPGEDEPTLGIYLTTLEFEVFRAGIESPSLQDAEPWFGAWVREWVKSFGMRDPLDPLVLDLDGDGIETTILASDSPQFDLDGNLFSERTGWLDGDDGFLARDVNQNGIIDDISELFGRPGVRGFDMLAELDSNHDQIIDAQDSGFSELLIWRDLNGDALTDEGELQSLEEIGIASFNLNAEETDITLSTKHRVIGLSDFTWSDGSAGDLFELLFEADLYTTTYRGNSTIAEWAEDFPDVKGHGLLTDLKVAASNDFTLAEALEENLDSFGTPELDALLLAMKPIADAWIKTSPATRELAPVKIGLVDGVPTRLDYGIYKEDDEGGYWEMASGAAVPDENGGDIARPALSDILNQGESWELRQIWSPHKIENDEQDEDAAELESQRGDDEPAPIYSYREAAPYLVKTKADGSLQIFDHGTWSEQSGWQLASGTPVYDPNGEPFEKPSLEDVLAQQGADGTYWQTEAFNTLAPIDPAHEFAVAWFGDEVGDYGVFIEPDGVWTSASKMVLSIRTGQPLSEEHMFGSLDALLAWYPTEYDALTRAEKFDANDIAFTVILGGDDIDEIVSLKAERDENGDLHYPYSKDFQLRTFEQVLERTDAFQAAAAVRIAAQTGLQSYFADVPYNADEDLFQPSTSRELIPLFEQIFANAPASGGDAAVEYLENWREIVEIVFANFDRVGVRGEPRGSGHLAFLNEHVPPESWQALPQPPV